MAKPPTTSAEALQTQFLEDMDAMLTRLERLQENLSADIVDATNKSLLAARLNFDESIGKQRIELLKAGKEVAEDIRSSLSVLNRNLLPVRANWATFSMTVMTSLAAGIAGGAITYLLSSQ